MHYKSKSFEENIFAIYCILKYFILRKEKITKCREQNRLQDKKIIIYYGTYSRWAKNHASPMRERLVVVIGKAP